MRMGIITSLRNHWPRRWLDLPSKAGSILPVAAAGRRLIIFGQWQKRMKNYKPREPHTAPIHLPFRVLRLFISKPENRPIMVGERTNISGSRKFKRLIEEGKFEEGSEIARAQVKNGAHVIDINLAGYGY